jgi:2',3'-cyclic-nucleotide 2'-phosphodiesterase (5'-nucleotidase family)
VLFVDSGDLLFPRAGPPKAEDRTDARWRRAAFLLRTHARMHLDAWAPSPLDLGYGVQRLADEAGAANLTLLASNLEWDGPRPPAFRGSLTLERGGVRIGLVGLVRPHPPLGPYRVLDPVEAASRTVAELAPRVDQVVVLSNLGLEADGALSQSVPGIVAILSAGDDRMLIEPRRLGGTSLFQAYRKGQYLGLIHLDAGGIRRSALRPVTDQDPEDPDLAHAVSAELP